MRLTTFSLVLCLTFEVHSQSIILNVLRKADLAFEKFSFAQAVEYYKLAQPKAEDQQYVISQIALSYRNLNEPDSAEVWLKKSIDLGEVRSEYYFYLAEALLSNQKYEEAKYWYQSYQSAVQDDPRSTRKLAALDEFEVFFSSKDEVEVEVIPGNSPGLDFAPAYYRGGVLFVSSRPRSGWVNREFNWDASTFLDYYVASDSTNEVQFVEASLNTKYHEGPAALFNDNNSIVYTRNNYDGKKLIQDEKGITNLKIYFATWNAESEKWENEESFQYNSDAFSNGAPAISEDGNLLVFSSDRPGGFGESDLYYATRNSNNSWNEPVHIGEDVNTKGRDGFPFIFEGELYFASDGREGLGGLDLYKIKFENGKTSGKAINLGSPYNSNRDDFGLIRKGKTGYFASNRNKETSDDIFSFEIKEPQLILVSGDVYDVETDLPIHKSDVFFKDKVGTYLYTRSSEDGSFSIRAPANTSWLVTAGKFNFELVDSLDVALSTKDTLLANRIYLRRLAENFYDSLDVPDAIPVVDNRIKPYNETSHFVDEFVAGDTLKLDMVYFDLDKADLRPLTQTILDKAANFMIEHVDVKIILASHTDSRSSHRYNELLSARRSINVTNYLIEMGVDPDRIYAFHYGEKLLSNDCADGNDCHEDDHQENRRTEVIFVKQKTEG